MEPREAFDPDSDVITGPEIPGAPVEPVLDVDEIQGNILLGLKVDEGRTADAKSWLARLVPSIATLGDVNTLRNLRRSLLRRQAVSPGVAGVPAAPPSMQLLNIAF